MYKFLESDNYYFTSLTHPELVNLYETVENYVKRNYLYNMELDDAYLVAYNHKGPDIFYSLTKLDNYGTEFIDLEYVFQDKLTPYQESIKSSIEHINDEISDLKDKGLSLSMIKKSLKI